MEKLDHQEKLFNRISLIGLLVIAAMAIYIASAFWEQANIERAREKYKDGGASGRINCEEEVVNWKYTLVVPGYSDAMVRCGLLHVSR